MRKTLTLTAMAAVIAMPLLVGNADAATCHSRKTTGTILGGVGGALLGNAVSHGGGGAVVGGLGGAVVGHEIGKGGCRERRTYTRNYRSAPPQAPQRVYYDSRGNAISSPSYNNR